MTPPDIDGLPTLDDPPLVYRVLEELPDGRVRYESCDGVQTGKQIGVYVIREPVIRGWYSCFLCGASFQGEASIVDRLHERLPLGHAPADYVALSVDEISRRGESATHEWGADQACRAHRGLPVQSFREWQEERAS